MLLRHYGFSLLMAVCGWTWACTGIQLPAQDNTFVNGRTVEFGISLDLNGLIIPRNFEFTGTLPDGKPGLHYRSKYQVVGSSAYGIPSILDGVNEQGLSVGVFYFPDYASYTDVTPENKSKALSPAEFSNWVITQFASVDEVKAHLKEVVIVPSPVFSNYDFPPPFHYIVYDKSGKSLVIEPINGELKYYDNPLGVFTNSPTFDWHLTNLSNYINLSPINVPSKKIHGYTLQAFGQGSGLLGMPGDFTPPSRFVQAAIFSSAAIPEKNAEQTVFKVFHLLNQFDIPPGSVIDQKEGNIEVETTSLTTVKDPNDLKYYFKTYADQSIKVIDLKVFDPNSKQLFSIPFDGPQTVLDVSKMAKPKAMDQQPPKLNI